MTLGRRAWLVVGLLWVVGLLNYLDRQVIFSVFPLLASGMHLSSMQLGLLSTVFLWVYGVFSPIAGYLGDRFGRSRVVLVSLMVWSIVTWATGHAQSFSGLIGARALMGISEACYIPAALAMIADYHDDRSRALATGIHNSGIYAGIVLGGLGGGWMGQRFGWRFSFTLLGIAGVLYFLALAGLLKDAPAARTRSAAPPFFASLGELLQLRGFLSLTAVFSGLAVANWVGYTWLPLYLYERFHVSLAIAGFTGTFYIQAGSVAGILLGGQLSDRWILRTSRGRVFTQALALAAAGPSLFLAGSASWLPLLIAGLVLFGIGRGMFDANAMPVLCQFASPELRSTGYGVFNMAGSIVGGIMTAMAGAFQDRFGLSAMLQAAALCALLSALALLRLPVPPTSNVAPAES